MAASPVACAIAEAVLDTIHAEKLQENALTVGLYLTQRLTEAVKNKYPWVGDVRGNGLFQGVEIIHDRRRKGGDDDDQLRPYPELTKFLVDHLRYGYTLGLNDMRKLRLMYVCGVGMIAS